MKVSVTDAKAQLTELVRRAEAGDEVVLTRHGQPTVRLIPVQRPPTATLRRAILQAARDSGRCHALGETSGARSQDDLYDEFGLPK